VFRPLQNGDLSGGCGICKPGSALARPLRITDGSRLALDRGYDVQLSTARHLLKSGKLEMQATNHEEEPAARPTPWLN